MSDRKYDLNEVLDKIMVSKYQILIKNELRLFKEIQELLDF